MATVNLVSVCLGSDTSGSMRIGRGSNVRMCNCSNSTAVGQYASAGGDHSTALGQYANACDFNSTALGQGAIAIGSNSTALGQGAIAGNTATALGQGASACRGAIVLQSGSPCSDLPPKSRIKICGDNISFRINGVCKTMTGSQFFTALGLS